MTQTLCCMWVALLVIPVAMFPLLMRNVMLQKQRCCCKAMDASKMLWWQASRYLVEKDGRPVRNRDSFLIFLVDHCITAKKCRSGNALQNQPHKAFNGGRMAPSVMQQTQNGVLILIPLNALTVQTRESGCVLVQEQKCNCGRVMVRSTNNGSSWIRKKDSKPPSKPKGNPCALRTKQENTKIRLS